MNTPSAVVSESKTANPCLVFHSVKQARAEITIKPWAGSERREGHREVISLAISVHQNNTELQTVLQQVTLRLALTQRPFCSSVDFGVNSLAGFLS